MGDPVMSLAMAVVRAKAIIENNYPNDPTYKKSLASAKADVQNLSAYLEGIVKEVLTLQGESTRRKDEGEKAMAELKTSQDRLKKLETENEQLRKAQEVVQKKPQETQDQLEKDEKARQNADAEALVARWKKEMADAKTKEQNKIVKKKS